MTIMEQLFEAVPQYTENPRIMIVMTAETYEQLAQEVAVVTGSASVKPPFAASGPMFRGVPIHVSPYVAAHPGWHIMPRLAFPLGAKR